VQPLTPSCLLCSSSETCSQVPWGRLKCVEIGETVTVAGVQCTFLDANHCPGAIMILFQPPGRRTVLHTGDCRRVTSGVPCGSQNSWKLYKH